MKKVYISIIALLMSAAMMSGCGAKGNDNSSSKESKTETSSSQTDVSDETSSEDAASAPEETEAADVSAPEEGTADTKPAPEITDSITDLYLIPDHSDIKIGTDDNEIIFVARDIMDDREVELIDADTGEVVGIMLDDADFENSGDDIKGDAWFSIRYKVDVDFPTDPDVSEERRYHYYARYIEDSTEHRSNDVEIFVFEPFTDKELDTMETVDNAVHELLQSDEYKSLDIEGKRESIVELLTSLEEEGLIDEGGILLEDEDFVGYKIGGIPTMIMLKDFDPMLN